MVLAILFLFLGFKLVIVFLQTGLRLAILTSNHMFTTISS
jgi:hypothetical protein